MNVGNRKSVGVGKWSPETPPALGFASAFGASLAPQRGHVLQQQQPSAPDAASCGGTAGAGGGQGVLAEKSCCTPGE